MLKVPSKAIGKPQENIPLRLPKFLLSHQNISVLLFSSDSLVAFSVLESLYQARVESSLNIFDVLFWILSFIFLLTSYIANLYAYKLWGSRTDIVVRVLIHCSVFTGLVALLSYLMGKEHAGLISWRSIVLPFALFLGIWQVLSRLLVANLLSFILRKQCYLVLGDPENTYYFESDFKGWNKQGKLMTASLDSAACYTTYLEDIDNYSIIDNLESFLESPEKIRTLSGILIASDIKLPDRISKQLMELRFKGVAVYDLKNFYQTVWYRFPSRLIQQNWFTFGEGFSLVSNIGIKHLKRLADLLVSASMLLAIFPLMVLTAFMIKIDSPGPIFYAQWRSGLRGKPFRIYKFRSMREDAEQHGVKWAQKKDPRITRVGLWLRLLRIDEIPQLWNVLRGDMSIIGPRPERPEFDADLEKAIPHYTLRYLVKPGITGWAQVMYPYGASVEDAYEKLSYDLYYIKNYSIWLDLKIVLKTIRVVLLGKGR